jgi:hypothetical protein
MPSRTSCTACYSKICKSFSTPILALVACQIKLQTMAVTTRQPGYYDVNVTIPLCSRWNLNDSGYGAACDGAHTDRWEVLRI